MDSSIRQWYEDKLTSVIDNSSGRGLYLLYSLCGGKLNGKTIVIPSGIDPELSDYLILQKADLLETARIYSLIRVLEENRGYFGEKVTNLIQIADTSELETFLKYLILLPNAGDYLFSAVEALRTNIATIFDAITLNNPYPSSFFNEQQWNQMYLKAAFMQRNLGDILDIEKMANQELARIISDYAHERWAASRDIDPEIWRPVSNFLNDTLLNDMSRLFESQNMMENRAAALCCFNSNSKEAKKLLNNYTTLKEDVENQVFTWDNFKN